MLEAELGEKRTFTYDTTFVFSGATQTYAASVIDLLTLFTLL